MTAPDVSSALHPGESVERTVELGPNTVVVTGMRVLSFTPGGPGRNYRAVDRPNVDGVAVRTRSDWRRLAWAGSLLATALLLLAGWFLFDVEGLFAVPTGEGASALGVGGVVGQIRSWLGLLDAAMLWGGILLALSGAAFVGLFLRSRERVVAVVVAGEEDLTFPAPADGVTERAAADLRAALGRGVDGANG